MAPPSKQERRQMRQRGAASRQIQPTSFGFSFGGGAGASTAGPSAAVGTRARTPPAPLQTRRSARKTPAAGASSSSISASARRAQGQRQRQSRSASAAPAKTPGTSAMTGSARSNADVQSAARPQSSRSAKMPVAESPSALKTPIVVVQATGKRKRTSVAPVMEEGEKDDGEEVDELGGQNDSLHSVVSSGKKSKTRKRRSGSGVGASLLAEDADEDELDTTDAAHRIASARKMQAEEDTELRVAGSRKEKGKGKNVMAEYIANEENSPGTAVRASLRGRKSLRAPLGVLQSQQEKVVQNAREGDEEQEAEKDDAEAEGGPSRRGTALGRRGRRSQQNEQPIATVERRRDTRIAEQTDDRATITEVSAARPKKRGRPRRTDVEPEPEQGEATSRPAKRTRTSDRQQSSTSPKQPAKEQSPAPSLRGRGRSPKTKAQEEVPRTTPVKSSGRIARTARQIESEPESESSDTHSDPEEEEEASEDEPHRHRHSRGRPPLSRPATAAKPHAAVEPKSKLQNRKGRMRANTTSRSTPTTRQRAPTASPPPLARAHRASRPSVPITVHRFTNFGASSAENSENVDELTSSLPTIAPSLPRLPPNPSDVLAQICAEVTARLAAALVRQSNQAAHGPQRRAYAHKAAAVQAYARALADALFDVSEAADAGAALAQRVKGARREARALGERLEEFTFYSQW
ncbi:hypothetical protein BDY21DRAFT_423837 [Lineolata rhizophorae]|uniref:Uncharacterized protein n=1 Tax=Lineolata rhizophorae TaxID=578093 RepID=A0A6A6NRB9_9PEZI|nr:hypothetical protein BDY21DRAFT_423837 [Lineolata rhizophorae]